MYTSENSRSSKKTLHSQNINETSYSFAGQFHQHPSPYQVNKRLSQQVGSYPFSYNLNDRNRVFNPNTFNSGWSSELSKIQQLNSKISRTTEQILQSRQKSRVSEYDHYQIKHPDEKKKKYYRQYVRYQPTSLTRNNYGYEPVIIQRQSKDNDSQGKRSRKSSTKINFIYENSPSRKNTFQSDIERIQRPERDSLNTPRSSVFQSPISSKYRNNQLNAYRSTQLILANNRDLIRNSQLKKDVNFIYQSTKDHEDYNPNTKSAISSYEMAKYSPKVKEKTLEVSYLKKIKKDPMIKMTGSSYLQENFGIRKSQGTQIFKQKQKQQKKGFYQIQDYKFEQKENSWEDILQKKQQRDVFYDMEPPRKTKMQTFSFKQPTQREDEQNLREKQQNLREKQQNLREERSTIRQQSATKQKKSGMVKSVSQIKDKQSKMIAIVLIVLALMIFLMQLFS